MIISGDEWNKFTIRNSWDLSVIKTVEHEFGNVLNCGLCYPNQKIVILGIEQSLIEFNYEMMKII